MARSRGVDVLHDPVFNKGTAHPLVERERLGLRGLLPPRVLTMEQQVPGPGCRVHGGGSLQQHAAGFEARREGGNAQGSQAVRRESPGRLALRGLARGQGGLWGWAG